MLVGKPEFNILRDPPCKVYDKMHYHICIYYSCITLWRFQATNMDGDRPLHVAAAAGNLAALRWTKYSLLTVQYETYDVVCCVFYADIF
jgi:hypothetical protein